MADEIVISFTDEGNIKMIYTDALVGLLAEGEATLKRVSHVEPAPNGGWTADMSPVAPGVVLGPFPLRCQALAAEVEWLRTNLL